MGCLRMTTITGENETLLLTFPKFRLFWIPTSNLILSNVLIAFLLKPGLAIYIDEPWSYVNLLHTKINSDQRRMSSLD